ncbi:MAG: 50S ribosomal protein L9 [Bacteroidota bacterium]
MKVILRQDVENLGSMGDSLTVKDGYGRNYLIPRGMAYYATSGAMKVLEGEKKQYKAKMDKLKAGAEEIAAKLAELQISVAMKVGEEGRLFGTVTPQMIGQELEMRGFGIDRRAITIDEPIKTLGVFDVQVKLHPDVIAPLKVWVISAE